MHGAAAGVRGQFLLLPQVAVAEVQRNESASSNRDVWLSLALLHCCVKDDTLGNWGFFFLVKSSCDFNIGLKVKLKTGRSQTGNAERLLLDLPDLPFHFKRRSVSLRFCGMFVVVVLLLVVVLTAPTHTFHPSRTH